MIMKMKSTIIATAAIVAVAAIGIAVLVVLDCNSLKLCALVNSDLCAVFRALADIHVCYRIYGIGDRFPLFLA